MNILRTPTPAGITPAEMENPKDITPGQGGCATP